MRSLTRELLPAAVSVGALISLGLGGIAYAEDAPAVRAAQVDAELCASLGANVDTPLSDLSADVRSQVAAALGLDGLAPDDARTPAAVLDCGEQPVDPPATDDPTGEPEPTPPGTDDPSTEPPGTDTPPATEPPGTEAPVVDLDCGDLAPGEADRLLADDPSDPNRLDRDGDGVPCEIEDFADEAQNPDAGGLPDAPADTDDNADTPTPGSGSNSQFDSTPSFAPETGRA